MTAAKAYEKAKKEATPEVRKQVKEYQAITKELRRLHGKDWVHSIPEECNSYVLKMHQLTIIVWMADHSRTELECSTSE